MSSTAEIREVLCGMLRSFHARGWASGTGGGICALEGPGRLLLAPTGVHKELVAAGDLFVIDPRSGAVLDVPSDPALEPSACASVFRSIVNRCHAGAVVHSHALSAVLAADTAGNRLSLRRFEMLKGIRGVSNRDEHHVPIIENTSDEADLVGQVDDTLTDRADVSFAILVRDHGAYIWGDDVWEAKRHAEVYHWLFEASRAREGEPCTSVPAVSSRST